MNRRSIWAIGAAAIAAVWLAISAGVGVAKSARPTAEKLIAHIEAHPLDEDLAYSERARRIERVAKQLNAMDFEQRQRVQFSRQLREMQASMSDAERLRYLDLALPRGMKQFMEAFNEMPPEKRARHLGKAMEEIELFKKKHPDPTSAPFDAQLVGRIVQEGTTVLLRDASAQSKIEMQPLIDEVQHIIQTAR